MICSVSSSPDTSRILNMKMIHQLLLWTVFAITLRNVSAAGCTTYPNRTANSLLYVINYTCTNIDIPIAKKNVRTELINFERLKYLTFTYMGISEIENDFFSDKGNLQLLNLSHNKLQRLIYSIFYNLAELEYLDLSHNNFTTLDPRLLKAQINLHYLILSHNQFTMFHKAELFSNLSNLIRLDLSNNKINFLGVDLFNSLQNLKELLLTNNNLVSLPEELLSRLTSLTELHADGNSLICNCNLSATVRWINIKGLEKVYGTCRKPATGTVIKLLAMDHYAECLSTTSTVIRYPRTSTSTEFPRNSPKASVTFTNGMTTIPSSIPSLQTTERSKLMPPVNETTSVSTEISYMHEHSTTMKLDSKTTPIVIALVTFILLQVFCCIFGAIWYWKKKKNSSPEKRGQEILVDNQYEYDYVTSPGESAINLPDLPARPGTCAKGNVYTLPDNCPYEYPSTPEKGPNLKSFQTCEEYDYACEELPSSLPVKSESQLNNRANVPEATLHNDSSGKFSAPRASTMRTESRDISAQADHHYDAIGPGEGVYSNMDDEVLVDNIFYSEI